jgi:hypothetical protein
MMMKVYYCLSKRTPLLNTHTFTPVESELNTLSAAFEPPQSPSSPGPIRICETYDALILLLSNGHSLLLTPPTFLAFRKQMGVLILLLPALLESQHGTVQLLSQLERTSARQA